ncbi:MAG: RAMP superfamily CRISPR-associated protein [Methylococcales bacterium]
MQNVAMRISLEVTGPLLTQSTDPGELGLDCVVARNKGGTPYLPGTLIVGKLRQALEELQSVANDKVDDFRPQLDRWFGRPSKEFSPNTKQLYFSDFVLQNTDNLDKDKDMVRHRIKVDEGSGAVAEHQIVTLENPFVRGETYRFEGTLHFFAPKDQTDIILRHVKTGFNWLNPVGGMKSIGFGQVVGVDFDGLQKNDLQASLSLAMGSPDRIGLRVRPLYPFCIARARKTDNLFESEAIIPGGAIIGSIATTWNHLFGKHRGIIGEESPDDDRKSLHESFSKLRITHAFPSREPGERPVVAPLSLVKVSGDENYYDVAVVSKPCLIGGKPPDFALDWKDPEALSEYPWPYLRMKNWAWASPDSELRVRTAIDPDSKRSAKEELFANQQILPNDDIYWYAELDLDRIDSNERLQTLEQLNALLEFGIAGLGKTKTSVAIEFTAHTAKFPSHIQPKNGHWIITLQTDSLIGCPNNLDETAGVRELRAMYRAAWEEFSNGKLDLVRYFARQKLSGGHYQHAVFGNRKGNSYRPWLLTEAGSVFVLKAVDDTTADAQALIQDWLCHGLPLAPSTREYHGITEDESKQWKDCPYIAQNGYGEIAVNISPPPEIVVTLTDASKQVTPIDTLTTEEEESP